MQNTHSQFLSKWPGTYFSILPSDLLRILDAYYYGLLEITVDYTSISTELPVGKLEHLRIVRFDFNGQVDTVFHISTSLSSLIEYYIESPIGGGMDYRHTKILWRFNVIYIIKDSADRMNLNGEFITKLFWQKIQKIVDTINILKQRNLSIYEIDHELKKLIL